MLLKTRRYVTGQSTDPGEEFVFVQYKGHTLQGSYDGGFVYARKPFLPKSALAKVARVAKVTKMSLLVLVGIFGSFHYWLLNSRNCCQHAIFVFGARSEYVLVLVVVHPQCTIWDDVLNPIGIAYQLVALQTHWWFKLVLGVFEV